MAADWQDINDLATQLNAGEAFGDSDFNRLLLRSQRKLENKREWMILKGRDVSLSLTPADYNNGQLTGKNLPQSILDSMEFLADKPVVLIDPAGNEYELFQIPMEARQQYYNMLGYFFIDYYSGQIYFTGQANQTYTVCINFKRVAPAIAKSPLQNWIFPARFKDILAFGIVSMYKKGIDYDFTNALQVGQSQDVEYSDMYQDMIMWDAKMQVDSLKGMDRFVNRGYRFQSGSINMNR